MTDRPDQQPQPGDTPADAGDGVERAASTDPSRLDELIALASLGELSTADDAELAALAASDPAVAAELDEALAMAAELQADVAEPAPAALRSRVLDAITDTPQDTVAPLDTALHATLDTPPGDAAGAASSSDAADGHIAPVADLAARRRWRGPLLAAAAAVVVIGGAVVVVGGGGDGADSDQIAAVVDADDASIRTFDGDFAGSLTAVHSPSENAMVLTGADLAQLSDAEVLQLWLIGDGDPMSVGTFRPDDDGVVSIRFDGIDPSDLVLGVTVEPTPGSEVPTMPIVATA